ncbi:MAG TPA: phosphodiester glycosidase family protein [Anaeromyxobacter sp.]
MLASALAAAALVAAAASPEPSDRAQGAPARGGAEQKEAGSPWQALEPGMELALFDGPPSDVGDRKIAVLRIDPARFELRLLNASAPGEGQLRTARAWAYKAGASAAINASMYQEDYLSSVSLMRTREHVNQRRLSKDKAVLAFDPLVSGVPPVRIVDRDCEDFADAQKRYGSLVQSIRMISCDRRNVWAPSDRRFSSAAIGTDAKGRVLFIHARTPWTVNELVKALLALPIDLAQAMYVEGGPEAQLFARGGAREIERVGGFEGAARAAEIPKAWPVPNVIVAVRRR